MTEEYIPGARNSIMGYFGASNGVLRQHCVTCNDKHPLTAYGPPDRLTEPHRIYGEPYGTGDDGCCDVCGVTFLSLSQRCQREHDEQQERFAKLPTHTLIEYGVHTMVRCRVY